MLGMFGIIGTNLKVRTKIFCIHTESPKMKPQKKRNDVGDGKTLKEVLYDIKAGNFDECPSPRWDEYIELLNTINKAWGLIATANHAAVAMAKKISALVSLVNKQNSLITAQARTISNLKMRIKFLERENDTER